MGVRTGMRYLMVYAGNEVNMSVTGGVGKHRACTQPFCAYEDENLHISVDVQMRVTRS